MPLHDWRDDRGWSSVHMIWQYQLLHWVQKRLPPGYRAYLGSVPALTIGTPNGRPDMGVRTGPPTQSGFTSEAGSSEFPEPDAETVAVFELDPQTAIHIDLEGKLIAAIEIVSPRNKDRPDSRERYSRRYVGYVRQGVHLMLIDVLPRPRDFSFADVINADLRFDQRPCSVPFAVSYRVGEPVPDGTILGVWCRQLRIGEPLPTLPLALTVHESVLIDLEFTYSQSAREAYLE
jgi:hypothetical protein